MPGILVMEIRVRKPVQYIHAAEGVYTVELTVTNQCGTHTSTETINNYTPVSADFSSDLTSGCANLTVEFDDQFTLIFLSLLAKKQNQSLI